MAAKVRMGRPRQRQVPAGTATHLEMSVVGVKCFDGVHSEFVLAGGKGLELIAAIGTRSRDELRIVRRRMGDDVRVGHGVPLGKRRALHSSTSHNSVFANGLQSAQSLKLPLCISNGTANVAVEIEHHGIAVPQIEEPMIAHPWLGQARALRRAYRERIRRLPVENLLRDDGEFLFIILRNC